MSSPLLLTTFYSSYTTKTGTIVQLCDDNDQISIKLFNGYNTYSTATKKQEVIPTVLFVHSMIEHFENLNQTK